MINRNANGIIMKRNGFTLVESLVSALIIGVVGMSAIFIVSNYLKITYSRDMQTKAVIQNLNTIERLKSEVSSLSDLYEFQKDNNNIRIIAVGVGEAKLSKNGDDIKIILLTDESIVFSPQVRINDYRLFRIIVGDNTPNTNLTAILYIGGDDGA
jgi:prepilin-type N-terminal cleavage/methylation domain-containing protein